MLFAIRLGDVAVVTSISSDGGGLKVRRPFRFCDIKVFIAAGIELAKPIHDSSLQ